MVSRLLWPEILKTKANSKKIRIIKSNRKTKVRAKTRKRRSRTRNKINRSHRNQIRTKKRKMLNLSLWSSHSKTNYSK
jgi:hypothetical protein